jgi:hypothetical protein
MPNPSPGTNEWLEIYNPENLTLNLSEWKIGVNDSNYSFSCENIFPCSLITNSTYFLLISKKANISQIIDLNVTYYNSSYVYTFPNDMRAVYLYNNGNVISSTVYPSLDTNISWARINDTFIECMFPTPGASNDCGAQNNSENNSENGTYPAIFASFPPQVWNNKTNFTLTITLNNFSSGLYDLKIDIKNSTKYLNRFWIPEINDWSDKNAWVDNFTGVNSSEFVQNLTCIIDSDERFVGNASLQIRLRNASDYEFISDIFSIKILNGTQNSDQNQTEGQESNNEKENESTIRIVDAPEKAKFGSLIEVELEIYRGNTGKYAVYVYVEDENNKKVSEKVTLHVNSKYTDYDKTVDVTLNCKNNSGDYEIIAEGLEDKDSQSIFLSSCDEQEQSSTQLASSSNNPAVSTNYQNESISTNALTGSVTQQSFESKSMSFLKILPYILSALVLVLGIAIIFRKKS